MKSLRLVLSLSLFFLSFKASAAEGPSVSDFVTDATEPSLVMDLNAFAPATQLSVTEIPITTQAALGQFLTTNEATTADVLLSTDSEETFATVARAVKKTENKTQRLFRFIPLGKLASAQEKFAAGWKSYSQNVYETVHSDKIGMTVVIITTAVDSFIWIHSTHLSIQQRSAMVMMNIIFAATFGLDRDLWTKMTTPLRHKIIRALDRFGGGASANGPVKSIVAAQFIANMTFSVGLQFIRRSLLSMTSLGIALSSSEFWIQSLEIGAITTAASFAWSELSAAVNSEKNPVAKNSLKRLADIRNIVLSQIASTGMVMQPQIYGLTPIVSIVVSGGIGLMSLIRSNRVIDWLEKSHISNKVYKNQMTFEQVINSGVKLRRSCEALFAG